jgi:hypothetical protein
MTGKETTEKIIRSSSGSENVDFDHYDSTQFSGGRFQLNCNFEFDSS